MLLVLFFIILCGHVIGCKADSPYAVEIDNYEIKTEYDHKFVNWDTLGLKKKGRNKYVVSGTFSLNRNMADEQKINIQVFPYDKDNKAKGPLIYNMEKEICKFVAKDKDLYPGLVEKSNLPPPDSCPIPKNEYTIDDYELYADFLPADIRRGDYLVVLLLKDVRTPVAGLSAVITISDN